VAAVALVAAAGNRVLLVGPWPASEFFGADPERLPYGILDPRHFLETAWLLLLLVPSVVALPFLRGKAEPADRVLLVAAASAVAAGFLALPVLGYARDWDLMALPALPLAWFAARRVERAGAPWFGALVLGLVLARTAGWIGVHHDPEAALRRAEAIAAEAALNSDFARSHLHDDLSHVLEGRGRPQDALVHAVAAATLRPGAARMHYRIGYLARRHGDPAVAERSFAEAVRLAPDFFDARHELGMTLVGRSAWEDALVHLRAASDLRPADIRVRANLAVALINAGRVDDAAPEVRWIAASPDPARERALANVIRALEAAGAPEAAARVRELL
jgi:tetratricopeptide (TPR) repeat protein